VAQCAALAANGLTDEETAVRLGITTSTVGVYLAYACRALGIEGRAELAARFSRPDGAAPRRDRNTAEPSGELSVGDVVAEGEVPLAVAKAGWTPAAGSLNEVRTSQHGTRPLPERSRPPDTGDRPAEPSQDQGAT